MVLFIEIEANRNQNGLVGDPKFCSKLDFFWISNVL